MKTFTQLRIDSILARLIPRTKYGQVSTQARDFIACAVEHGGADDETIGQEAYEIMYGVRGDMRTREAR